MPLSFPKNTIPKLHVYKPKKKKSVARVALLTGCVQRVISPQINEATIRLLNRHGIEVVVPKNIDCCGSLVHHLGKSDLANPTFKKNSLPKNMKSIPISVPGSRFIKWKD